MGSAYSWTHASVKGIRDRISNGKTWVESGEIQTQTSLCSLPPVRGHTKHAPFSSSENCSNMCSVSAQRCPLETQSPKFFLCADHIGIFCLANIKVPDWEKADVQHKSIVYTVWLFVRNGSSAQFLDTSQEPTLEAGPCKRQQPQDL